MGKRFGIADLVAAVSAVGFTVMLAIGVWFTYELPLSGGRQLEGSAGLGEFGWFALFSVIVAVVMMARYLFFLAFAKTQERIMLSLPIAFWTSSWALLVLLIQLAFTPDVTIAGQVEARGVTVGDLPTSVAPGALVGLLFLLIFIVSSWKAMSDERDDTAAAREQTERLLEGVVPRPAPPVAGPADPPSTDVPGATA